jgi:hypothetical protein
MHYGARRTYKRLKIWFPGSKIPFRAVQDYIRDCPRCQVNPKHWTQDIKPIVRTIIPRDFRTRIGIDTLKITPRDRHGNTVVIVIVNLKTKLAFLYPAPDETASTIASAIIQFISLYGLVDEIVSDPGRNITSKLVKEVNDWLGLRHFVSLVDVHESNGVERTNEEILRHLRALVNDERLRDSWSEVQNIALIQFALNERVNGETGHSAYELTFGSADAKYFRVGDARDPARTASEWLVSLNASLDAIRDVTKTFQDTLVQERVSENPHGLPHPVHPVYVEGDLVLYDSLYAPTKRREVKLANRATGPYRVVGHYQNDVTCRHVCTGVIHVLPVDRLSLFVGSDAQAERLALEDAEQDVIESIDGWRGDPAYRTSMEFWVKFRTNNDFVWHPWSEDFADSLPYEQYCQRYDCLRQLLMTTDALHTYQLELNRNPITSVQPGDEIFVSLRYFDFAAYDSATFPLPSPHTIDYVVKMRYTQWDREDHTKIEAIIPVFGEARYSFRPWFIEAWGSRKVLLPSMRLVDLAMMSLHEQYLLDFVPSSSRGSLRRKLAAYRKRAANLHHFFHPEPASDLSSVFD